ncbi:MAG: DUF4180 domain-containing protein [Chloroflexota bacterium]
MNLDLQIVTRGDHKVIEGRPGTQLLRSPDDIVDVIGTYFEHRSNSLLLYAENLTDRFFDLSSGDAGAILQKLRNYHIRIAIVASPDAVKQSTMFGEMVLEESKGGDFRIFDDSDSAEMWLTGE